MRILSITAGAAGMYCGSCARDNALAADLMARGCEVTLVPVYTPTRTDEPNVSYRRVLFGGISVYLQQHVPLFRHTPRFLDRLWDAPSVIDAFAGRSVSHDPRLLGDLTVSMLRGEQGVLRKGVCQVARLAARRTPCPISSIWPNSLLIALAAPLGRALQRPVCCTLQGEEQFIQGLPEPYQRQAVDLIRRQVQHVDRFIAVSEFCARYMGDYLAIPSDKMAVVPLGIHLTGYERRQPSTAPGRGVSRRFFCARCSRKGTAGTGRRLHTISPAHGPGPYAAGRCGVSGGSSPGLSLAGSWRARGGGIRE